MIGKFFNFFMLMCVCLTCFCAHTSFACSNDCSINTFENQFETVSDDKYYVKSGTVFVSSQEIFLCFGEQLIPVTFVECDEYGVFVRRNAFKWGQCSICHWPLTPWGTCSNSACPTKG